MVLGSKFVNTFFDDNSITMTDFRIQTITTLPGGIQKENGKG